MARFFCPPIIHTGAGCLKALAEEASKIGRHALFVTGQTALRKSGTWERIHQLLKGARGAVSVFDQVEPEPSVHTVDSGRERLQAEGCDLVVAAGGGSALDVGKAIAGLANEPHPTADYLAGREVTAPPVPSIAIPTTSGTGAEVTRNAVLTDPEKQVKASVRGDGLMPAVAIIDPELTLSLPPQFTARAGMDALTQAVESYLAIYATPLTEALSVQATGLLARNLPTAFERGDDLPGREACAYGSLMAGLALGNARLGAVHGLAHPLGVRYHIPHGLCCAVLLPHVLRANASAVGEKWAMLEHLLGGEPVAVVERLLDRLQLPHTLSEFGLRREDFPAILEVGMQSGSFKANPRKLSEEDCTRILQAASGE